MVKSMPGAEWIFISYRRSDTAGHAGRLYDRMTRDFGGDAVFFDNEKIDAGADFPDRLSSAMDGALVVVAVIGPDWLTEINKRAKKRSEVDFVRQELAQALRPNGLGAERLFVPVLMGGAAAVTRAALAPALRADVGDIGRKNARDFCDANWVAGYNLLVQQLEPIRLARAGGAADHAAMAAATAAALRAQLDSPQMQALAAHWDLREKQGVFATNAEDLLTELGKSVQTVATAWRQDPHKAPAGADRDRFAQVCRQMATDVLKLGVDPEAARAWVRSGANAPCATVGMAAVIRAVAVGEALVVDPVAAGLDFRPERYYELEEALDNGAAARHQARVARGLWPDAYAKPPVGDMNEAARKMLAIRIKRLAERDRRSFVVTAPIDDPSHRSELTELARPLNAVGLGRQAGVEQDILREPEAELVDAFCLCLEEIEKLS